MNERWRVVHGSYGAWRVMHGAARIAVFTAWWRAYEYAREQAVYENLNIVSIEVCS